MTESILAAGSALWLGILTSISPCPLATNIAAISFIGRRIGESRHVLLTGLLYTLGRTLTYLVLGVFLVSSILSSHTVSHFLQKYMNMLLGPILIVVGMLLLELIRPGFSGPGVSEKTQRRVESLGIWGAGLLGIVFALSFCPIAAALFFGSLMSLAVRYESSVLVPTLYGIGTGLPVFLFAILIALGTQKVAAAFNKLTQVELWARRITGIIFILVGIYLTLTNIFGVFK